MSNCCMFAEKEIYINLTFLPCYGIIHHFLSCIFHVAYIEVSHNTNRHTYRMRESHSKIRAYYESLGIDQYEMLRALHIFYKFARSLTIASPHPVENGPMNCELNIKR